MKTICMLIALMFSLSAVRAYSDGRAGFTITVNGEKNPYQIFSVFLMPGKEVTISSDIAVSLSGDNILSDDAASKNKHTFNAPENPGAYQVNIESANGGMILNVLVLTPTLAMKGEYLNGYRIGLYPAKPLRDNPIYNAPKGLFEVTKGNQDIKLTPHFTLKQFLCKQAGEYPKYLIVRERLLLKLEYLLERTNEKGYRIETFGFISGYRTPYYNKSIKNVQYSRHVYGGAADIIIDQDQNGSMDDLNKDGVIDEKDVQIFYDIVEGEYSKERYKPFIGGLGFYRKNGRHNGFIHVDVRGSKARW